MATAVLMAIAFAVLSMNYAFSQTPAINQEEIESRSRQVQQLLHEKKPDLAIAQLEAILALDPSNVNGQANLGVLLYFRGDYSQAELHLQAALNLQPGLSKIQGLLGIAQKRAGKPSNARVSLEAAFPALADGAFKAQAGMELIELYTASGDLELAGQIVGRLRRLQPENLEVQYAAYRIYSDLADDAMLTMLITGPESAQVHQVIAREASRRGDANQAIEHEREAIKINQHLPGIHLELAELLGASGNLTSRVEAEHEYLAAMSENRFDERAQCGLGRLYGQEGKWQDALEHYSAAIALQADDAEANSGMAQTLIEMNEEGRAVPYLEKAVKLDPTEPADHYRLSRLYRQQGKNEEASREVALYLKYKEMKDKLGSIYKDLHLAGISSDSDLISKPNK